MNFKMKTLVAAALATVAMSSGSAFAIGNGNIAHPAGGTSGPSEMFVMAYDTGSQNTFIAALGGIVSSPINFTGTSNLSTSFAADSDWNAFKNGITGNVTYAVMGLDVPGHNLWTTANPLLSFTSANNPGSHNVWNQLSGSSGPINLWMQKYNMDATGNATSLIAAAPNNGGYALMGKDWGGKLPSILNSTSDLGANNNFYLFHDVGGTNLLAKMTRTQYMQTNGAAPAYWNLSTNGTLTFTATAVPEANTWAMMLAGLGLMGFVARRRA